MTLAEFMEKVNPNPSAEAFIMADDYVLAISTKSMTETEIKTADPGTFEIVEAGLKSVDGQLNPQEKTSNYIRRGQSTVKSGTQRAFTLSLDRYAGDPVQDFFDSFDIKYGRGQTCVIGYAFINMVTGKGEKGLMSAIVNTDCSGASGENAGLEVNLKSNGVAPIEYTYTAPAGSGET